MSLGPSIAHAMGVLSLARRYAAADPRLAAERALEAARELLALSGDLSEGEAEQAVRRAMRDDGDWRQG